MREPNGPLIDAARLEALINRFEDAWERGERPSIDDHLASDGPSRFPLLVELVHVELESRLKAGDGARVEEYLTRYPELGQDRAVVIELLEAEKALRERLGATVSLTEYLDRFPDYRDDLRRTSTVAMPPGPHPVAGATEWMRPADGPTPKRPPPSADPPAGMVTRSRYRVLRLHARGGLGEILTARDDDLNREVALKRLQGKRSRDPESCERFLREAEITGQLEHPGVVPVYGLGHAGDGSPIYAMRFIRGETLQEAVERFHREDKAKRKPGERRLAFRQLLGRLVSVCNTIAYAHSRGIIHRDLKPSNILLGGFGETLVVDWGLAKAVGEAPKSPSTPDAPSPASDLTQDGTVIGTPAYMSPEQAAGMWERVGPAGDVYSLGATLYMLLTGQAPFAEGQVQEVLTRVQRGDFLRPRQVNKAVPPALEAVCQKAMAMKPEDRYPTALALARDLERWLAGDPVSAWREPIPVRARRWVARHSTLVTATVVGLVACAALAVLGILWAAAREREQVARELAEERQVQLARADREGYYANVAAADRDWWSNRFDRTLESLEKCKPELRRWEWNHLVRRCQDGLLCMKGHTEEVWAVAYSPDGKRLASASLDGTIKVWNASAEEEPLPLKGHTGPARGVAFSPDGQTIASGSEDRSVRLWDAATGKPLRVFENLPGEVNGVSFSRDGKLLAAAMSGPRDMNGAARGGEVRVWDLMKDQEAARLKGATGMMGVAFSPDGKTLAAAGYDKKVWLWDAATGQERPRLEGHVGPLRGVAFSPDGQLLASASNDGTVGVWDLGRGKVRHVLQGHGASVWGVCFSPDGTRLASSSDDMTLRVWDVTAGQTVLILHGHAGGIAGVTYSPDGTRLASASDDKTVRVWDARESAAGFCLCGHKGPVWAVAYSPDGKRIASAGEESVRIWDSAGRLLFILPVPAGSGAVAFSPDGARLAAGVDDRTIRLWDVATGKPERVLRGHRGEVLGVAFSPDGRLLASASWDRTIRLWDPASGEEVATLGEHGDKAQTVAFSPDGKRLASGGDDKKVKLWDVAQRREERSLGGHTAGVSCLAWSPDGKRLAAGTVSARRVVTWEAGEVTLWDPETGQAVQHLRGHLDDVRGLSFSPDGSRLVSAGTDWRVKIWDPATGQEMLTLRSELGPVHGLAFSPDGQYLASANGYGNVVVRNGAVPPARRSEPGAAPGQGP